MDNPRTRWVQVFARLKPGYTVESAAAPLQTLFTQLRQHETTLPGAKDWSQYARDQFMKGQLRVESAAIGYSGLRNEFSTSLVVLMCMVGLVLLIACANVANLLIARGIMRQREIAVRLSLGAGRGQLVRQLLTESLVLSVIGGALGIWLSIALTKALLALMPTQGQPLLIDATPDLRILSFTLALSIATGVIFGLLPALGASRPDPWLTLKDTVGAIAGAGRSLFLRKGLVAAQVALSFLLLFGAGLFVRSLQNLQGTETGVQISNLITFQVSPALSGYDDVRTGQFYEQLLERLNSAPGIISASTAAVPILSGNEWDSSMGVEGYKFADGEDQQAFMNALSPGYFATMKIPMLEGRDFTRLDAQEDARVAIVNRKFAEHFFPKQSAIGKRLGFGGGPNTKLNIEIVGVVDNSLYEGPREGVHRQVFVPRWGKGSTAFYVRAQSASESAYNIIRNEVRQLDAAMPRLRIEDAGGAARRDAAQRSPDRHAVGGVRLACDDPRLGRSLRRHGVRRRAPAEGAGPAARARRRAGERALARDEGSRRAARHRPGHRDSRGHRPRPLRLDAVVRDSAERPVDRRRDRRAPYAGVRRRGLDPGASRQQNRSDPGT